MTENEPYTSRMHLPGKSPRIKKKSLWVVYCPPHPHPTILVLPPLLPQMSNPAKSKIAMLTACTILSSFKLWKITEGNCYKQGIY